MKKLRLEGNDNVTFREGCEHYLDDCGVRNLRQGTIGHAKLLKFFRKNIVLRTFRDIKTSK